MNTLYLAGSLAGVGLLIGLNVLLFGVRAAGIDMREWAWRLSQEWPGFRPGASALARGARTALLENAADGSIFLAAMRGDSLVERKLHSLGTKVSLSARTLSFEFADYTFPAAAIEFEDDDAAAEWNRRVRVEFR